LTACLSDSNWPVKRSGYLLSNSLEVRFTVSIRTLPKPNSPNAELDMQVAFNINFANQGSVNSSWVVRLFFAVNFRGTRTRILVPEEPFPVAVDVEQAQYALFR